VAAHPTFLDVPMSSVHYPFVESAAGSRAQKQLIDPAVALIPFSFQPDEPISRLDFVVAIVRTASLEDLADARAGEILPVMDSALVPYALRGYVGVALELGLIGTVVTPQGPFFDPDGSVPRLDASMHLLRLLDLQEQVGSGSVQDPSHKRTPGRDISLPGAGGPSDDGPDGSLAKALPHRSQHSRGAARGSKARLQP
jgi:hypothetical protein